MSKTPYYSRMARLIATGKFTHDTVRTFECGQYNYFIQKIEDSEDTLYCLFIDVEPKELFGNIYCLYIDEYLESVVATMQIYQTCFLMNTIKQIEDCMTGDTMKVKFIDEDDEEDYEENEEEEEEEPDIDVTLQDMVSPSSFSFNLTDLLGEEGSKALFGLILEELDKEIDRRHKEGEDEDDEESDILPPQD